MYDGISGHGGNSLKGFSGMGVNDDDDDDDSDYNEMASTV